MELTQLQNNFSLLQLADALGLQPVRKTPRYIWYLCPFHEETEPSFVIDQQHRVAKCFNPTCIAFKPMQHVRLIQMVEHLPKNNAIDRLYQLAGADRPINSLHEILASVLSQFTQFLDDPVPSEFFKRRGIRPQVLKELQVGYSPSFARAKQFMGNISMDDAAKLELFRAPMFESAIIYPLFDGLGRMAGFRSRSLGASHTKYLGNTASYPLQPSRVYGLHLVRNTRQIILVEGPNDVLGMRSAGLGNVVGLMGLHLKDIDTYLHHCGFDDIVLLADGDVSGKLAMAQAPDLVRVTQIPSSDEQPMDPDEYARDHGTLAVAQLINDAKWPFLMRIEERMRTIPDTLTGKIMLVKTIARDLSDGLHPIIINKAQDQIAFALKIPKEDVTSIFALAEFDTSDLENKIVYHVASSGEFSNDIKFRVQPEMFSDPRLRAQYATLLRNQSPSDAVITTPGLMSGDIDLFVDLVSRRNMKKVLRQLSYSVSNLNEPVETAIGRVLDQVARYGSQDINVIDANQYLSLGVQNAIERAAHPGELLGISLGQGFHCTNQILQGVRPNAVYVLAASSGMGKSALALEWALDMAFRQKIPTLWISLEMSPLEMSVRALSKLTGFSATDILRGAATNEQAKNLEDMVLHNADIPFYLATCSAPTVEQVMLLVRKYKILHDIKVVFVDYLQLMRGGSQLTMFERIGYMSNMLKSQVAMDPKLSVPVVAVAQLNRDAARRKDVPTQSDVAESYKISQDSDVFMTIKQLSKREQDSNAMAKRNLGNMVLHIDKNRMGIGNRLIGLTFNQTNLTIKEVADVIPYTPEHMT